MLSNLFIRKFIYGTILCIMHVAAAFCSSKVPFIEAQDLNFKINIAPGQYLESGSKGNIYIWDSSYVDQEKRKIKIQSESQAIKKFDVFSVHKELHTREQEIRKDWKKATDNIVTAAFTLIFQKEDFNYYAMTQFFSEDASNKGQKTLGFISGTEGRDRTDFVDAKSYSISDLFQSAIKRSKQPLFINPDLEELTKKIQEIQEEKVKKAFSILKGSKDILEMEKKLKDFDIFSEFSREKNSYNRTGGYGPIADSEQFLLHYLEEELICFELGLGTYKGIYMSLLNKHVEEQFNYLSKNFSMNYRDSKIASEIFKKANDFAQDVRQYKPIGAFLHVYSTREFCQFCATSLLDEFYYEENNFVSRLKEVMKDEKSAEDLPFFVVLGSYQTSVSDVSHELRPKGTKSSNLIRKPEKHEIDNGVINLNEIIINKILPLLEFK